MSLPILSSGELNDLWRFSPTTGWWGWIGGSPTTYPHASFGPRGVFSPASFPGGLSFSVVWVMQSGEVWFFGGYGCGERTCGSFVNNLWRFSPSSNMFAFMGGAKEMEGPGVYGTKGVPSPTNFPGARASPCGTVDEYGRLWLFGGFGVGALAEPSGASS
jgi:N-acetylneuraminic acid mutarotase